MIMRKQQEQVSSAAARAVWWQGNRYGILSDDGHSLPLGGRRLPRESASGTCVTRHMMPYIKLGSYRGTMVVDRGGPMGPLLRGPIGPARNDDGGWTQVNPKPRALKYSVISSDRIGR